MSSTTDVPSLVDRLRYPLEGAGRDDLVRRARASLHHDGAVELPGFVTEPAVALLAEEARDLAARRTWRPEGVGTAYLAPPDPMVPSDHPTRHLGRFATGVVPYDLFGVDSLIRQFYEWEPLRQLVEDIVDRGPLHPYGDPFGALNLAVMENGDELQWHFDQTDFVVSLAIASATSGGRFEAAPRVRTVDDERFSEVQSVIEGRSDQVYVHPMVAGTLLILKVGTPCTGSLPLKGTKPAWWPCSPTTPWRADAARPCCTRPATAAPHRVPSLLTTRRIDSGWRGPGR